jgi:hypothetical protein
MDQSRILRLTVRLSLLPPFGFLAPPILKSWRSGNRGVILSNWRPFWCPPASMGSLSRARLCPCCNLSMHARRIELVPVAFSPRAQMQLRLFASDKVLQLMRTLRCSKSNRLPLLSKIFGASCHPESHSLNIQLEPPVPQEVMATLCSSHSSP